METRQTDTVTTLASPLHTGQTVILSRADVETIVDARIADHLDQINSERRRLSQENFRHKTMTMGVGAAVGLGLGIGSTLLIQRIRRRSMTK